ncbi:MAG: PEP-utilizing enzyme [archaeon]
MSGIEKYRGKLNKLWYIQSFNGTPILINMAAHSGLHSMYTNIGYGYNMFMVQYKDDFCEWYYDREDLHNIAHKFEEKTKKNPNYLKELVDLSLKDRDAMFKFMDNNLPRLKDFSDEELLEKYNEMIIKYSEVAATSHVIEGFTLTRDIKLKAYLMEEIEKKGLSEKSKEYFIALTMPVKMPFVTDYNNHLAEIIDIMKKENLWKDAEKKKSEVLLKEMNKVKKLSEKLDNLEKNFYWIKASYSSAIRQKKIDFVKDLIRIKEENEDIKVVPKKVFDENLKNKAKLEKKLKLSEKLAEIIRVTDVMNWWHDDRKKYILHGCVAMEDFMTEIGKRFKITNQEMKYLMPTDITLKKIKSYDRNFFNERIHKGCAIIYTREGYDIFVGEDFKEFKKIIENSEEQKEVKQITGMVASLGKVMGRVKICRTIKDIESFKRGEVLVTGMTRPEFVPAMSKACAIVTDEGGITSHAAVISRELKIPCVIGTKIATKVLKNGDLVEVNANHSMVKIID